MNTDIDNPMVKVFFYALFKQMVDADSGTADLRMEFISGGSAKFKIELTHINDVSVDDEQGDEE